MTCAAFLHDRENCVSELQQATQVYVDHLLEVVGVSSVNLLEKHHASIVDADISPCKSVDYLVNRLLDICIVGHVCGDDEAVSAVRFDLGCQVFRFAFTAGSEYNTDSLLRE